ncbi:MAG: DUF4834 family protein [Dysgonamonadaceae bacterium]|jgi:hypothetical protein|nr:DUF4834 family protein [Dysgonamonadaceae bacterium]
MFKFLIISFLLFLFFIFLFGFSVVRFFFQAFLGRPSGKQPQSRSNRNTKRPQSPPSPPVKKIITREEGEYVDYEEVKD